VRIHASLLQSIPGRESGSSMTFQPHQFELLE
jgi:hypothetical protein